MSNLNAIKKLILDDADFWNAPMSEGRLNAFASQLARFSPQDIFRSQLIFREEAGRKTMPMPADLISKMNCSMDPDTKGKLAAARVIESVSKFGYTNLEDAKNYIGELGWKAVQRFGGWQYICENLGVSIQISTFQAQIRDVAIATDKAGQLGMQDAPIGISAPKETPQLGGGLQKVDVTKLIGVKND